MAALRSVREVWICLTIVLAFAGCRTPDPQARQYALHGQILAINPDAQEVLIKHGDIQGFMPGMTMPFKVRDRALLDGKAPGDLVTAQLMVAPNDAWLSALEKTGTAPLDEVASVPPAAFVKPVEPGDPLPDVTLTDQNGSSISLTPLRGQALVVTFIYTRCPLPQFCPLMDRRFAELQQQVTSDAALAGRVRLLSVSFDPDHDRPAALKAHAARLEADPSVWTFATAEREVVDRFAAQMGVNVIREDDRSITHNLRTVVAGPEGRVAAVHTGGEWTAAQVVTELRRTLASQ